MHIFSLPKDLAAQGIKDSLIATYSLDHALVHRTEGTIRFKRAKTPTNKRKLLLPNDTRYEVRLPSHSGAADCVVCVRDLLYEEELRSRKGNGRVAFRFHVSVDVSKRRRGIARKLLNNEESYLFKDWRADEIQALVKKDGFLAWTSGHSGYRVSAYQLRLLIFEYKRTFSPPEKELKRIKTLAHFPEKFWKHCSEKNRFEAVFYKRIRAEPNEN